MSVPFPTLRPDAVDRLARYGTVREIRRGEELFRPGDRGYDFFVIVEGAVTVVQPDGEQEVELATHGPGRFLGELNMLTGSQVMVTARVEEPGRVLEVPAARLRELLDRETDLARTIVDAFIARRALLQRGPGARSLQILGSRYSPTTLELRQFAVRMRLPHTWEDLEDHPDIDALLAQFGVAASDTPVVVTPTGVLRRPSPGELAHALGLTYQPLPGHTFDVAVVGAGPAGLAAAVYAASEGLQTIVVDARGPGGQAGSSSLIENFLGFPSGISGGDLTDLAAAQAHKFGAQLTSPCEVSALTPGPNAHTLTLHDGQEVPARVVVIASGARYRRLPIDGLGRFEGAGVYYAATDIEARACDSLPVVVIGGGNSAGQAALHLADHAADVQICVRRDGLAATMSRYLVERISANPRITVRSRTEVVGVHGDGRLRRVDVRGGDGVTTNEECAGLFCFIGAEAATSWLPPQVRLDAAGFVLTDRDLPADVPGDGEHRDALPYETSLPGVLAAGDVRHGSTKRVATAAGEGSAAIRSAHLHLAAARPGPAV